MQLPPPVNPDLNAIADQAKFGYAVGRELLSAAQYRLGELAGTGHLDPDESIRLQEVLFSVFDMLYVGTIGAIRGPRADNSCETDNTYSDGRQVRTSIRMESPETSRTAWKFDQFMLDHIYYMQCPRGSVTCIAPVLGRTIYYTTGFLDPAGGEDDDAFLRGEREHEYEYMLIDASRLEHFELPVRPGDQ